MIKYLNLDKTFCFKPELDYKLFKFPGGETSIKISSYEYPEDVEEVIITCRITNAEGIMEVLLAKDALDRLGFKVVSLALPYIPYARQDRVCDTGEAFSLKIFTNMINSANFNKVTVFDPHSDVAPALIDRCDIKSNLFFVLKTLASIHTPVYLISPDAGSNKKCNKIYASIPGFRGLIKCDKTRDPKTGNISGFEVLTDDLHGYPCLIVDDICDGGGTFIGLAEELKAKRAGDLYLFVTHGIFSKGLDELGKYFKKIYCTNSFSTIEHPSVEQIKLIL
jgi:ribose-phosphate pyrophosphokinase